MGQVVSLQLQKLFCSIYDLCDSPIRMTIIMIQIYIVKRKNKNLLPASLIREIGHYTPTETCTILAIIMDRFMQSPISGCAHTNNAIQLLSIVVAVM